MKIIVLAGGADQIALISELKQRGHYVILIDYLTDPPAKDYADKHIVCSTLDVEAVKIVAKKENVGLITTACTDQALLTIAQASEELGLPCYISYKTALNVTNKTHMKAVLINNGIPTAKYFVTDKVSTENRSQLTYPIVVKPVDCNSSKGVVKIYSESSLQKALKEAIQLSRTQEAIIEEFKEGQEISADFFIQDKRVILLSVTGSKKVKGTNAFTIIQSIYPVISEREELKLIKIAEKIMEAFNLDNTPLLVQLIEKDGKFDVIEFSARMGGGSKYKLIEVLSGVNIMKCYVDLILGEKVLVNPQKQVHNLLMNYIYCYPGIVKSIKGNKKLISDGTIDAFFQYKTPNSNIIHATTSNDRIAGFLITGETKKQLQEKLSIANQTLAIIDEKGEDIMIHSFFDTDDEKQ